jgi:hypothetical protein
MTAITHRQPPKQGTDLLRLGAAAALAGASRPTLAGAVDRGDLRGERRGEQRVVRRADLEIWAAARRKSPTRCASGKLVREISGSLTDGYALGGYAAIATRHPRYVRASTAATVWTTRLRFAELLTRTRTSAILRDEHDNPVAIWRFRSGESVRVLPWPEALGHLVAERGSVDRLLTADRLLAVFAIEQALRARDEDPDLETLVILASARQVNLAAVLNTLDRASTVASVRLAIPLGTRASSIVEAPLSDTARSARALIAAVLRRIADVGAANPSVGHHRGELRPLGRSGWREIVAQTEPASIDGDRLLSLVGSV